MMILMMDQYFRDIESGAPVPHVTLPPCADSAIYIMRRSIESMESPGSPTTCTTIVTLTDLGDMEPPHQGRTAKAGFDLQERKR